MKKDVPKIVALVPMRHDSERVPGKNFRLFGGSPLYHHIVTALQECPDIDDIVIDTDSPVIIEDVKHKFHKVLVIERPEHLRGGLVPMNSVLLYDVSRIQADYYLQTHSTNPLLTAETIQRAIDLFLEGISEHDSLFSVTKLQARLWDADGRAINHDPEILGRTQDLPPVFLENSCLYIFSRSCLENRKNRIGKNPIMFEMDPIEAFDIDEEQDFLLAEKLYLLR